MLYKRQIKTEKNQKYKRKLYALAYTFIYLANMTDHRHAVAQHCPRRLPYNGECQNSTPVELKPLNLLPKNVTCDYSGIRPPMPNFMQIGSQGGYSANGEI